ncbi:hypothetical protein AC249_AIPGENE21987 [Exaiptasia diaphana]|nr:hypothetical protein AC249_AIPGENE21987 [Exaiptasia diaphana]
MKDYRSVFTVKDASLKANRCLRISPRNTPVENCDVGSSCIGCLTELNITGCTNGRDTNIVCLQNRTFGSSREHNNISSVFPKAPVERWCDCEECSQFIWRFLPEELN